MALTDNQKLYAMYVIGEVESNWTWTSVNYNDPITVGMMQWYGTRAAGLLNRCKTEDAEGYAMLADSLRSSLDSHDANSTWWTSRYLTLAEGNSFKAMAERDENHVIQQNQFFEDLEGYLSTFSRWGMPDTSVKEIIFTACMYHQSPARCGNVISSCGATASLSRIYTTCMNDGVLGQYRNRYTTAYNRLSSWDGTSAPPDFGQVTDPTEIGGDTPSISTENNLFTHLRVLGDTVVVYGRDQYANGIVFRHMGGNLYKPAVNKTGTEIEGGNSGGGSETGSAAADAIMQWYYDHENDYAYAQAPGRLDPPSSGIADCSSTVWYAYHTIAGIDVGTSTQAQLDQARSQGKIIAQGSYGQDPPFSEMHKADIVLMDLRNYTGNWAETDHVELYDGDGHFWGQRGGMGPNQWSVTAETFSSVVNKWWIARYL